jgi:DNA-binding CsgD family transcriptional regulator
VLLGFDDAFIGELCPPRDFGHDVLRDCLEEVEAGLVSADEHRAQIPDRVTFVGHRLGGGARSILQIGYVPTGDIRLDQVRGHSLEATATKGTPKWRNPHSFAARPRVIRLCGCRNEPSGVRSGKRRQPLSAVGERSFPLEKVVGRESELVRIRGFFDEEHAPLALWLEGAAGIGKTTLWRAGMELARERDFHVLACQPTAAETTFSFAALGDLLTNDFADLFPELPGPQRRALEVALALASGEGPGVGEHFIGLAFLSSLQILAAQQSVLVAVDDVQWLDRPSAAVLQFAARRLTNADIKLLVAARLREDARPLQLERDLAQNLLRVDVGPLSLGALHRLVLSRLGEPLSRPTLHKVHDVSGGNPFYALEIARFLMERGSTLRPAEPLPIPRTLEELVRVRLDRLPATVRHLLEAAALLAEPTPIALTAAASEPELEADALDRALGAGVIELEGDRVRFTHPLLATAVVSEVGPQRLRQVHARLAQIVIDPEERARHLALATEGPDAEVAGSLEQAAQRAARRGAPAVAAELAELAAQRTPTGDHEARWRRLIEAGLRYATAGDLPRARALLEPLTDEIPPGPRRAEVLLNLADFCWDDAGAAIELAERALAEVGSDDSCRARIHMVLSSRALEAEARSALGHSRAAHEDAGRAADEELTLLALVNLVHVEVCVGEMTPGLLDRALARVSMDGTRHGRIPHFESPHFVLGLALLGLNRFEEAKALFDRARVDSLEQGVPFAAACADEFLAEVECRLGTWHAAALHASECSELYQQLGTENQPQQLYATALVDAHLGNVDEARTAAERGAVIATEVGQEFWAIANRWVLGFLELSLDNPARAIEYLQPPARARVTSLWHMPSNYDFLETAIEAFVAVGDLDAAAVLLDALQDRARRMDSPWERATRARCRGLLRSAQGDHDGARAAFDEALREHEQLNVPFDRARTLHALGVLQRRLKQRRAARVSLEAALAVFEELGALLWIEKARTELKRIAGRTPAGDALTPTERRVAELVAEGHPNKEIAAMLFVTVKTVEANLTRIYAKLGVRSRTELARLLVDKSPVPEKAQTST